ncbi:hypothetical protein JCM1840_006067 [Sporobolomyces johnsonii]
MSFTPSLSSSTVVPVFSGSPRTLYFSYHSPSPSADSVPEIWTDLPSGQWHAIPFLPSPEAGGLLVASVQADDSQLAELKEGRTFEFTYRLRAPDGVLEWLGSTGTNGRVSLVPVPSAYLGLEGVPGWVERDPRWKQLDRSVAVGRFEMLRTQVVDPEGLRSGDADLFSLSECVEEFENGEGLVIEQSSRTWFIPRPLPSGSPLTALSPSFDAQLLLLRSRPSLSHPLPRLLALFPFSTEHVCSTLRGEDGTAFLRAEADSKAKPGLALKGHLAAAWGLEGASSPRELIAACVAAARSTLASRPYCPPDLSTPPARLEPQGLSLCTWNALDAEAGYSLSALLRWLDVVLDPSKGDVHPVVAEAIKNGGGVLLDDGWQDVAGFREPGSEKELRGLRSFGVKEGWYDLEREREGGKRARERKGSEDSGWGGSPEASFAQVEAEEVDGAAAGEERRGTVSWELRDAVRRVRERGVERVGVWMTLAGYWNGLHPSGALLKTYDGRLVTFRSAAHSFFLKCYLPSIESLPRFYTDYFTSVKEAGVSFVKVDDQALMDSIVAVEGEQDPGAYKHAMLRSMRDAAAVVDLDVVHCMAGSPRIWGGSLCALGPRRSTVRNSDDFFPAVPDSHRWHIFINSFNNLLTSELAFNPDLDMAQELHPFGRFHIALRAFSTAPVYSTDYPGEGKGRLGDDPRGWSSILATTKKGVKVLQTRSRVGSVLGGRSFGGESVTGDGDGEALKVGVAFDGASGAHLALWNCRGVGGVARTMIDSNDLADALEPLEVESDAVVVVAEESFLQQVEVAALKESRTLERAPRTLARPAFVLALPQREVQIITIVALSTLEDEGGEKSVRIACLGLMGKAVGLAAIRSVAVVDVGLAPPTTQQVVPPSPLPQSTSAAPASSVPASPSPISSPLPGTQTLSRQPSISMLHSYPLPQDRLPFVVAYLTGFLSPSSPSPTATSPERERQRTPRSELLSLAREFLRRPLHTMWSELKALLSFSFAAVLWAFQHSRNGVGAGSVSDRESGIPRETIEGRAQSEEDEGEGEEENGNEIEQELEREEEELDRSFAAAAAGDAPVTLTPLDASTKQQRLRVKLDYISDRLGFYVGGASGSNSTHSLEVYLDGKLVEGAFIKTGAMPGIVEIDAEGAWNAAGRDAGGVTEGWSVEVALMKA